ncbi:hypothetical protein FB45DRAFT_890525, partial [Roridomyces roridus]
MASPFTTRFGTNYCPTDEEIVAIQSLIIGPSLRVHALDDEIAALHQKLDALKEERDGVIAYVESHKALLSPVRRLPLDIVQEIFVTCLPDRNCVMSATEAPMLLGRICSSWRAISLSTPRIWSKLHIVEPQDPHHRTEQTKWAQRLASTEQWLARSGTCALSISVESVAGDSDATMLHLFTHILIPLASRWRAVHFSIPFPTVQLLSNLTEKDVPLLQDISIFQHPAYHDDTPESVSPFDMHIFRGLGITRASFVWPTVNLAAALPLRWTQLTVLHLLPSMSYAPDYPVLTGTAARDILSRCLALRICSIHVCDEVDLALPTRDTIECPYLHTLELYNSHPGELAFTMRQLFTGLSLPRLLRVRLAGYGRTPTNTHHLSPFLVSAPRLESLRIFSYYLTQDMLVTLLRGLPTLRRLHLECSDSLQDKFLDFLTPTADSDYCCPNLKEFVAWDCSISDAALLRFINTKMTSGFGDRLELVEGNFRRVLQLDLRAELQPYVNAGLLLRLKYPDPMPVPPRESFPPWQGLERSPWAVDPLARFAQTGVDVVNCI